MSNNEMEVFNCFAINKEVIFIEKWGKFIIFFIIIIIISQCRAQIHILIIPLIDVGQSKPVP
jgi:hypothetical protein